MGMRATGALSDLREAGVGWLGSVVLWGPGPGGGWVLQVRVGGQDVWGSAGGATWGSVGELVGRMAWYLAGVSERGGNVARAERFRALARELAPGGDPGWAPELPDRSWELLRV